MQTLKGKVAVVTGAARGIGRSTALELARRGASVVVNDQAPSADLDALLLTLASLHVPCIGLVADVSDTSSVRSMMDDVMREFGRIDILINNAAFSVRKPFVETSLEEIRKTWDVSQWGTTVCSQRAAQEMISRGEGGSIVMVSSVHAERPYPNALAYNAAKSAMNRIAESMALELASNGIRVNTVEPGWIDTPGERVHNTDAEIAERGKTLPMGRLGTSDEVARAIAFLCSDEASYITGATLRVDGGFALRF